MTVAELSSAYVANQMAADEKYKGKVLQIEGVLSVTPVTITFAGRAWFNLVGQFNESSLTVDVACFLPLQKTRADVGAEARRLHESLDPGQQVTVNGRVEGFQLGRVSVTDCTLVK